MYRYTAWLTVLLTLAVTSCTGLSPAGPGTQTPTGNTVDAVPFDAQAHVIGVLEQHFDPVSTKPTVGPVTTHSKADYLETARHLNSDEDVAVTGQFLFWSRSGRLRRGTIASIFRLEEGVWRHVSAEVSEGEVDAIPLVVRVSEAESRVPIDGAAVVARRKGSEVLSSPLTATNGHGEATLELLRGRFEIGAHAEGMDAEIVREVDLESPAVTEIPLRRFVKSGQVLP